MSEKPDIKIRNAIIKNTFLGINDHDIFTVSIQLDYGNSQQSFGQHDLRFEGYGIEYLAKILCVVGVNSWEELKGKVIRAKNTHTAIQAIGHFLEDKWFEPEKE